MMRTKITVTTILGLMLTGCPGGGGNATATATDSNATEPDTDDDSDEDSDDNSNTNTESDSDDPSTATSLTTDPSTSTDPTDPDSSSGGDDCTPDDACDEDTDCMPGQTCLGCICFGEPTGECTEWAKSGTYGDCINEGAGACDGGGCLSASETEGVCFFTPCETPCDCPQPPAGFEAQVMCENITAMGEEPDCFIGCGNGLDCPEGMGCLQNTICMFGVEGGLPPYSDCVNTPPGTTCEDGFCLVDNTTTPTFGTCADACEDASDCVVPKTGDVDPVCQDFGDGVMLCQLQCTDGDTCPDGMSCQFDYCGWDVVEPWGDCENNPAAEACLAPDTCIDTPEGGICGSPCEDAGDCDDAPATGTAVVQCTDLGAGNICSLSCAMGETCPDGMACFNDSYCHFEPS